MATRVENLSAADQELAPGSGFIPAGGSRDFPSDVYKRDHERYAKARLEADPPLLRVTEVADSEATPVEKSPAQQQTEQNADEARKAAVQQKAEDDRIKANYQVTPSGTEERAAEETRRKR